MSEADNNQLADKSFWGHLDDLRKVLFKMAGVLVVFMVVFFINMPYIFDNIIMGPCHGDFVLYRFFASVTRLFPAFPQFSTEGFEVKVININLATQFFTHLSTSFWLALTFSFPFMLYFLWSFIKPALYDNEIKGARTAFLFGSIMFFVGIAVGYFLIFPITLRFLYEYQLSATIENQLSLNSYMDTFLMLIFLMGLMFELPLLAWTLSAVGFLKRKMLCRYRRHAVVVLLVLAALITPTGDPFTLSLVFLPLYLLYELSILIVRKS